MRIKLRGLREMEEAINSEVRHYFQAPERRGLEVKSVEGGG
jgi:hypothetical protein